MALLTTHIEAHLDELESLLPLRAAAAEGRHWTLGRVLELDERIDAHRLALQLFGDDLRIVVAPFVDQHPVSIEFLTTGIRPAGVAALESEFEQAARLATPNEALAIATALWTAMPHPSVYAALADLGRPGDVQRIILRFGAEEPRLAIAAGLAFTVLTGCRCTSDHRVALPLRDGSEIDPFDKEFVDEAWLPDARVAMASWERIRPALDQAVRINRGFIVNDATAATHPGLDRREVAAAALRFRRRNQA